MGNGYSLRLFTKPVGSQCQADFDAIKHLELDADELSLAQSSVIRAEESSEWRNATLRYSELPKTAPRTPVHLRVFLEPADSQLFWTQLHFVRRLHHPNVATIKGYVFTTEHVILVTESSAKGTLRQLLDSKQVSGLPLQAVLSMAKDIAQGLLYLNSQGIKYPILTSNNIVVQDTDIYGNPIPLSAVLSDLGDWHVNWQECDATMSSSAMPSLVATSASGSLRTIGKRDSRGKLLGVSLDMPTLLYNYGVLLWEMFTGAKPRSYLPPTHDFTFKSAPFAFDVTGQSSEYFLAEKIPEDMPRELANLIYLCWSKKPFLRIGLAECVEVLNHVEQTYLGNTTSLLLAERLNKTKVAFLNRIENLLDYIDQVGSLSINVTDLLGSLEDLSEALERSRNLDLEKDFPAIDVVLEVLESIFPSRIIDKKSKQLHKYWAEYASSKKGKFKLEHTVGQIVFLTSDLNLRNAQTMTNNSNQSASRTSMNVGSSKLIHQILFDNLAPGHSIRVKTPAELALIAQEEQEAAQKATVAAATPAPAKAPVASAASILGSFGISGGSLGADSKASTSKEKDKKDKKDKKPKNAPVLSGANMDVLKLVKTASSTISSSVATTSAPAKPDSLTSPKSTPKMVAIDPSTMSTDDYFAQLVTGTVGKSVVKEIDTKGTVTGTLEKAEGAVYTVSQIQGKQYYGEEIGFGPTRKHVVPSSRNSFKVSPPGSTASAPSSSRPSSTNLTTSSSTKLSRPVHGTTTTSTTTTSGGGWNRAVIPGSQASLPTPTTTHSTSTGSGSTETTPSGSIASSIGEASKPAKGKRTLFRWFKKDKKAEIDPEEVAGPGAAATATQEAPRSSVVIDSVPHIIQEQREHWLQDSKDWNVEVTWNNAPGSATSEECGFMPITRPYVASAPSSTGSLSGSTSSAPSFKSDHPTTLSRTETPISPLPVPSTATASLPSHISAYLPTSGETQPSGQGHTTPQLLVSSELFHTVDVMNGGAPVAHVQHNQPLTSATNPQSSPYTIPQNDPLVPNSPTPSRPIATQSTSSQTSSMEMTRGGDTPTPPHHATEIAPPGVRVRVISTRRISLVERLNWDSPAKEFWRSNFGIGVNAVPWVRFSSALSEHMMVLPEDMQVLEKVLDNNGAGYVSAQTFSDFLNSHGPLSTALAKTRTYRHEPWFMWYLSHDDCITMLKHCAPGTYVVRFSQSSPGQFALTVKQSVGAFMKCLVYAEHGKYKSRPDETVTFDNLQDLIHNSSDSLQPYQESWHHAAWFKGPMSSEDSLELLSTMPIGGYFVRLSTRASHYVFALVTAPGAVIQEAFARDEHDFVVFTSSGELRIAAESMEKFVEARKLAHLAQAPSSAPNSGKIARI